MEDYSGEELDEVVLVELPGLGSGGGAGRIVYRNGGAVDAAALEGLCEKVRGPWRRWWYGGEVSVTTASKQSLLLGC